MSFINHIVGRSLKMKKNKQMEGEPSESGADDVLTPNNGAMQSSDKEPKISLEELTFRRFLYMEAAYRTQEASDREHVVIPRCTRDKMYTFDELFHLLYPQLKPQIKGRAFVTSWNGQTVVADQNSTCENILAHSPFTFLFKANDDGTSTVIDRSVVVSFECQDGENPSYFINVSVKPLGSTANSVYARLTLMIPHVGIDDLRISGSASRPTASSFILPFDILSPEEDMKKFDAIQTSTQQKIQNKKELDVFEDELMRASSGISYPGYNIGLGNWLMEQHRYYDAFVAYQRVYNCINPEFNVVPEQIQGMFYHACFGMGNCMQQLGFLDKASYYHQLAMIGGQQYIGAYVEDLALGSHNRVCFFLNQLRHQASQSEGAKQELARLEKVVADAEKSYTYPDHYDFEKLPIGYILRHYFDAAEENFLGGAVCYTKTTQPSTKILAKDDVWYFDLNEAKDSIIYLRYTRAGNEAGSAKDKSLTGQNNCIVLNVQSVKSAKGEEYVRVNFMQPNFSQNDEKLYPGPFNLPRGGSFVLGTTLVKQVHSSEELQTIYEEAINLKESNRIVEAMRAFEYIHNVLKVEYTKVSATEETENLFFDSCYQLGFCLTELGLFERATYFLDWAQEGYKADYAQEYVNCLCNNNDIRALGIIDDIMSKMQKPSEEEYLASYEEFVAFLKRRKVFVLLNRRNVDEAKKLLESLKTDSLLKDFAEKELEYIKQMEQQVPNKQD